MDASSSTAAIQVTNDGGEQTTLNGVCDWANEEENIKGKTRKCLITLRHGNPIGTNNSALRVPPVILLTLTLTFS